MSPGAAQRAMRGVLASLLCAAVAACGGGGGSGGGTSAAAAPSSSPPLAFAVPTAASVGTGALPAPAANVLAVKVDRGVRGTAFNSPYVTITVCTPGGSVCRDIDHVLLDTGSYGLRLAAAALPAELVLPPLRTADGTPTGQCVHFASGFAWGSVRTADVRLGGQAIAALPVQVIGDTGPAFATPPSQCSSVGANLGARLDANGVLGVGMQRQDCGTACAASASPSIYFGCTEAGCKSAVAPLANQVVNPVAVLPAHNNGVAVVLQQVPAGGVTSLAGALVLGIGTDTNNQLGTAQAFGVDSRGLLAAGYKGHTYPAFLDSGANGIYLPDSDLPSCGDFFCPAQPTTLGASLQSSNGAQRGVDLPVEAIASLPGGTVAASIGGNEAGMVTLGLPFFFGRTVFVALKDAPTPAGPGPYWAF